MATARSSDSEAADTAIPDVPPVAPRPSVGEPRPTRPTPEWVGAAPLVLTALAVGFASWFLLSRFPGARPFALKLVFGQWALLCAAVCLQWLVSAGAPARDRALLRSIWRLLAWLPLVPVTYMDLAAAALFAGGSLKPGPGADAAAMVFSLGMLAALPVALVAIIAWIIAWATAVGERGLRPSSNRWALAIGVAVVVWAGSAFCAFAMLMLLTVNV